MTLMNKFYENFVPPPEAPIYTPTDDEFKDPLAYIAKIKPCAEKFGIVKIKPPTGWSPPFAIDVKNFRFTPRLQKLNELEALSRIRLNFLDSLARFWLLQGIPMRTPVVDNKFVDLFQLRRIVKEFGGFDACCSQRRWSEIAKQLGAKPARGLVFRDHYDKIIAPYELHETGLAAEYAKGGKLAVKLNSKMRSTCPLRKRNRMMHCIKEVEELKNEILEVPSPDPPSPNRKKSRELKNLQFFGDPGPKSLTPEKVVKNEYLDPEDPKPKHEQAIDLVLCKFCQKGDDESHLLLCDTCDHSFHTYCLLPPLNSVPKGDWRCPKCITEEVKKPPAAYGFSQAERVYTLHSFGEMADRFKSAYFNMPAHHFRMLESKKIFDAERPEDKETTEGIKPEALVPCATVEKEFWRLVNSSDSEGLTVEYGADLLTSDVGSGFPRASDKNLDEESHLYAQSPWNLNNLPVLSNSVLSHITVDISGMKVPWVYVGMGEPKTWYAVSGLEAEQFETIMKDIAPELFQTQPDLLHHLVTMANPRLLMEKGLRISTTNQCAGEFVVTFPRAYHAGFNQGYNFAEAVNFCPPDWLNMGRRCVDNYSDLCRICVFSHDELIVTVANACQNLQTQVASAARDDFLVMLQNDKNFRRDLARRGYLCCCDNDIKKEERNVEETKILKEKIIFETIPDEERQCLSCATTCFLSAVSYRFTDEELQLMLAKFNKRLDDFDQWTINVKTALQAKGDDRLCNVIYFLLLFYFTLFEDFKQLALEAEQNSYPFNDLRKSIKNSLKQMQKCSTVADQLLAQKIHSIKSGASSTKFNYSRKLRLEEVEAFVKNLDKLCCRLKQADDINNFINRIYDFKSKCSNILDELNQSCSKTDENNSIDVCEESCVRDRLQEIYNDALDFDLQLPEIPKIKTAVAHFANACSCFSNVAKLPLATSNSSYRPENGSDGQDTKWRSDSGDVEIVKRFKAQEPCPTDLG
uniref:[histone H3]-trimethyl-L-lysine(4) demethylase n=1 Tax=Romanomermis culicivorax TaxID=13658 RepID=A0A915L1A2_ROMCU